MLRLVIFSFAAAAASAHARAQRDGATAALSLPKPSPQQLHYMDSELTMFMHFSICTFNKGCDGGQQNCQKNHQPWPSSSFDPTDLDTEQWAQTALDLGAKQVCLTVVRASARAHCAPTTRMLLAPAQNNCGCNHAT